MRQDGQVPADPPVPHQVKVIDSAALRMLEEKAAQLGLNQRLPRAWLDTNLAPSGRHYLRAGLWHQLYHRPEVPPHLRCELLLELRDGEQILSLLDVMLPDYETLPSVPSRSEYLKMARQMNQARSVGEWEEERSK